MKKWLITVIIFCLINITVSFYIIIDLKRNGNHIIELSKETIDPNRSIEETVYKNQKEIIESLKNFQRIYPLTISSNYHIYKNQDEILDTLEIVKIYEADKVAVALTRYSVESKVFRHAKYLVKIENIWFIHQGYFSEYQDDPFHDDKPEEAKKIIKEAEEWAKESALEW